ncbi:MAG: hypothetical protein ACI8VT_002448 [Saprospiraceae bacterium]|jgi:hypothetical protein
MKTNRLFYSFLITLLAYNVSIAQSFVNTSNEWYLEDCCAFQGNIDCTTYSYRFGDIITINNLDYRPLITNNSSPLFSLGEFYRELDGKVFMKPFFTEEELLIYDFNLQMGETIEIGFPGSTFELEVIGLDSITLNSGEKRKRMEVYSNIGGSDIYWIEGVGSELSTLNTEYMSSLDCWNQLNCYRADAIIEYEIGNCLLTSANDLIVAETSFLLYPNPVEKILNINLKGERSLSKIEVLDITGKSCIQIYTSEIQPINVNDLKSGIYLLKLIFQNGEVGVSKFVKN